MLNDPRGEMLKWGKHLEHEKRYSKQIYLQNEGIAIYKI